MKEDNKKKKICLVSSSGGHFEQLLMLRELNKWYETFIVTEKTKYNQKDKKIMYYLLQINRKEKLFPLKFLVNGIKSLYIIIKEKPDVIISTGVLAAIPMIWLGHKFHKKVIYIESFAKVTSPTQTGKFVYNNKLADRFYVQWESMLKIYPEAIYKGGIY